MLARDFFTQARVKDMRREIIEQGFCADPFVGAKMDLPVFGVNLACAYPFPAATSPAYIRLANQMSELDENAYAYPIGQTHVTIATFINFAQHQSPTPSMLNELTTVASLVTTAVEKIFAPGEGTPVGAFELVIEEPLISRKAAILPLSNPTDEIPYIRRRIVELLSGNAQLRDRLGRLGLNLPPLIHSSIMRFKSAPKEPAVFLAKFDELAARTRLGSMRINEILITTETKPYMRAGATIKRFQLEPAKS